MFTFPLISATMIYFNKSSVSINEDQGLLMFTINLTNPSYASTDVIITIVTTNGTANGEAKSSVNVINIWIQEVNPSR